MKKIFISQPMNGKTDDEILKEREKAIKSVQEKFGEDIEIINTLIQENAPECSRSGLWHLGKSLELLSMADVVYFAKGWETARGCKIENKCAIEYGIEIMIEHENEKCCATCKYAVFENGIWCNNITSRNFEDNMKSEQYCTHWFSKNIQCKNCEFYSRDDLGDHICVNNESDYCADWVEPDHFCLDWKGKVDDEP